MTMTHSDAIGEVSGLTAELDGRSRLTPLSQTGNTHYISVNESLKVANCQQTVHKDTSSRFVANNMTGSRVLCVVRHSRLLFATFH